MIAGLRTRAATTDQYLRLIAPAWSQRATYGDGLTRFEATTAAGYAERLAAIAPATIRGRTRIPAPARHHVTLKVDGPVHETWTLGYLTDTIYLRDLWMHRIDAARAARQPADLTASHDGRIVADIIAEWARRHGQPFLAELSGPAGATYASNPADPAIEHISLDAVEFCRTLAGRAHPTGLLATIVPF
jgi:hypothetical protein